MPDQSTPRVLVIESGDDWQAFAVPADWREDDLDRFLNGRAYGRAAVTTLREIEPAKATPALVVNGVNVRLVAKTDADGGEFVRLDADGHLDGEVPGEYYPHPCGECHGAGEVYGGEKAAVDGPDAWPCPSCAVPEPPEVPDLMAALEASLSNARPSCPECGGSGVSPVERGERCVVCRGRG